MAAVVAVSDPPGSQVDRTAVVAVAVDQEADVAVLVEIPAGRAAQVASVSVVVVGRVIQAEPGLRHRSGEMACSVAEAGFDVVDPSIRNQDAAGCDHVELAVVIHVPSRDAVAVIGEWYGL